MDRDELDALIREASFRISDPNTWTEAEDAPLIPFECPSCNDEDQGDNTHDCGDHWHLDPICTVQDCRDVSHADKDEQWCAVHGRWAIGNPCEVPEGREMTSE